MSKESKEKSLRTLRQASVWVERDGEASLAWWIQYRVAGKTRSMVAVLEPVRLLLPRDGIGIGFKDSEHDLTFQQMLTWLAEKGYRKAGPVVEPERV